MEQADLSTTLQQQVTLAFEQATPLNICGAGSKAFLGQRCYDTAIEISGHRGIIDYDPRELVLTARPGTPLRDIKSALDASGQMLAFEPPHFGEGATLGGTLACGLSAPRAPTAAPHAISCSAANCSMAGAR